MVGRVLWTMVSIFIGLILFSASSTAVGTDVAFLIEIDGPIGPAVEDRIARGFAEANRQDARLVILRIDTPGGLSSSTRGIIKTILASARPVACYVSPSGAHAASAGA